MSTLADIMLAWKAKLTTKMTSEQAIETTPERRTCYLIRAPQPNPQSPFKINNFF